MKVALKGLRQLTQTGPEDELDLDKTIRTIARNAGEIELIWRRARRNRVKVLLLMDVGGSDGALRPAVAASSSRRPTPALTSRTSSTTTFTTASMTTSTGTSSSGRRSARSTCCIPGAGV